MKFVCAALLALVTASSASLFAQAGPRRDGNWEITTEMQMANMPAGMVPPSTRTQCITKEEANDPQKALPGPPQRQGGPAQACKMTDQKISGNKVTWAMTCDGPMAMAGTGELVYATDTYTGNMTMNGARGGMPMAMTIKFTGKRLGDCTK